MISSAAQREETAETYLATGTEGVSALQQIAAERLAAHRSRRTVVDVRAAQALRLQTRREDASDGATPQPAAARVRDAVAARYLQSQSYREFLAVESQRALEQAHAEAEVAARSARAIAEAQRQLMDEIAQWNAQAEADVEPGSLAIAPPAEVRAIKTRAKAAPYTAMPLQVRMHEELGSAMRQATEYAPTRMIPAAADDLSDMADLDEEIEFRRAPEFVDVVLETQTIQANIIEFPRQLVAPRKARPRLAEGPLMEETVPEPQLRIFEVEPEQIAVEPEVAPTPAAPEWQSLRLGSEMATHNQETGAPLLEASGYFDHWLEPVIHAAPITRRLMCAGVDAAVLLTGLGVAAAVSFKVMGASVTGTPLPLLAGAAAATLAVFATIYRTLFFTLNEATPGMRAARVAFCTFEEKSPPRSAIRRRLLSTLLATCPLGMGLLWTALDADKLGWHDRMSRMYPRKY